MNGEEELRDKEGQWAYRLNTLRPDWLNDNDFFLCLEQAFKTRVTDRVIVLARAVIKSRARVRLSRLLLLKVE